MDIEARLKALLEALRENERITREGILKRMAARLVTTETAKNSRGEKLKYELAKMLIRSQKP